MQADFKIVIDACVLANIVVCDLLLRLAEKPRLFLPRWSTEILDETRRVHQKLQWPDAIAESWRSEVERTFPDSVVDDYEQYLPVVTNDEKDRHVLAASIRSGASVIVTFNLKDFPEVALQPWGIEACHPQDYLLTLYSMAPEIVVLKLNDMSRKRDVELVELVLLIGKALPNFSSHLIDDLALEV